MKDDCMQELCPKTGIVLSPPRIAIISRESETCIRLLELACRELGLFFRHVDGRNLIDGTGYTELRDFQAGGVSGGEERWAENGIIVCKEFVRPNARCGVVFCLDAKTKMPSNLKIETMIA
jgi:hypothetical protein